MKLIMAVSVIIILIVILLAVLTTSKAYSFKHTVDPIDPEPPGDEETEDYPSQSQEKKSGPNA